MLIKPAIMLLQRQHLLRTELQKWVAIRESLWRETFANAGLGHKQAGTSRPSSMWFSLDRGNGLVTSRRCGGVG